MFWSQGGMASRLPVQYPGALATTRTADHFARSHGPGERDRPGRRVVRLAQRT